MGRVALVAAAAAALVAPVVLVGSVARRACAADPFEVQVYDGTANKPGEAGLELHLNQVADGNRVAAPPLLATHHQTHMTLEPSYGLMPWWELGGYFQTALRGDGTLDYAGVKLRSKFVMPPDWHPNLRLGMNLELSLLPETYDADRWGAEMRPIVAWDSPRWFFAVNPIVGVPLAGDGFHQGPTFEPAAKIAHQLPKQLAFGFEYYGDLGPIGSPRDARAQQHYLYEVIDLLAIDRFELNAGVGEGLTPASNGLVFKVIVGYGWDLTSQRPPVLHPR